MAANLPLLRANLCPLTFIDVPEHAYSLAVLGIYEMTRVELLRDLFLWAYERSTQDYLAIKQDLAELDPLRLGYRTLIKRIVQEVVRIPGGDPIAQIKEALADTVPENDRSNLEALILDELRRLHEGVLARYGLRPSEFIRWRDVARR